MSKLARCCDLKQLFTFISGYYGSESYNEEVCRELELLPAQCYPDILHRMTKIDLS